MEYLLSMTGLVLTCSDERKYAVMKGCAVMK